MFAIHKDFGPLEKGAVAAFLTLRSGVLLTLGYRLRLLPTRYAPSDPEHGQDLANDDPTHREVNQVRSDPETEYDRDSEDDERARGARLGHRFTLGRRFLKRL